MTNNKAFMEQFRRKYANKLNYSEHCWTDVNISMTYMFTLDKINHYFIMEQ